MPSVLNKEAFPLSDAGAVNVLNLGFSPTAGNVLVVGVASTSTVAFTSIASTGASWTQRVHSVDLHVWESGVLTGTPGTALTVTHPSFTDGVAIVLEIQDTGGIDVTAPTTSAGTSATASTTAFTNTSPTALLLALFTRDEGDVSDFFTNLLPVSWSFELQANGDSGPTSTRRTIAWASRAVVSSAAYSATADLGGGSDDWRTAVLAFGPAPVTVQKTASLGPAIAATITSTPSLNLAVAQPLSRTADASLFVSDAPFIVLEPDRPTFSGLLVADLQRAGPSDVKSPTIDFEAQGVVPHDVVEIQTGQNAGHYVVRAVEQNVLSLQQELLADDPGPSAAVVRKERDFTAQRTAAVVMSQPSFNRGQSVAALFDVLIT